MSTTPLRSSALVHAPGFLKWLGTMWDGSRASDQLHAATMLHACWPRISLPWACEILAKKTWEVEGDTAKVPEPSSDDESYMGLLNAVRHHENNHSAPGQHGTIEAECPDCGGDLDLHSHVDEHDEENVMHLLWCLECSKHWLGTFGLHSLEPGEAYA